MRFIKIIKHEYEPEWCLGFTFSNGSMQAYQEIYTSRDELLQWSQELVNYPALDKEIIFQLGSESPKDNFAYLFKIKIFMYNYSGHTSINITLNNNQENYLGERSHFNILCAPSDINNFGNELLRWCDQPTNELFIAFNSDILKY